MATLQDLQELFADRKPHDVAIQISGFTGWRTTNIEDLTAEEINTLYAIHAPKLKDVEAEYQAFKSELILKAWRSKILATAEKAGIKKSNSFHEFNNWMLLRSKYKKQLYSHSIEELKDLHRQLFALITNNRKSSQKPMTKAWLKKGEELKNLN